MSRIKIDFFVFLEKLLKKYPNPSPQKKKKLYWLDKMNEVFHKEKYHIGDLLYECQHKYVNGFLNVDSSLEDRTISTDLFSYHYEETGAEPFIHLELMGTVLLDTRRQIFSKQSFANLLKSLESRYPNCKV